MDQRRAIVGGVLAGVLITVLIAGVIYLNASDTPHEDLLSQLEVDTASAESGLTASGFIEAEEVELAAELGGRVVALPFQEGDTVQQGDVLVQLDTAVLDAQLQSAQAQLNIAIAQRDLLQVGVPESVIQQGEAQVALVQASVDAAQSALNDAIALRNNPQDLQVQLVEAQTQVQVAQDQVDVANSQLQIADRMWQLYADTAKQFDDLEAQLGDSAPPHGFSLDLVLTPQRYQAAQTNLAQAQQALVDSHGFLAAVSDLVNNPQQLQAQVNSAQTALATAEAQLEGAQAELDRLRAGPKPEDVEMANAKVAEAQAAVDAVEARRSRMALTAPISGIVLDQSIHVGELAAPGVSVVTLADLDTVNLTVYIAAGDFDQVSLNQRVEIAVDSFPGQTFEGTVIYISDQAEFTPRNVQTQEERVNLVYAVKVRIDNPDHALKPGMPADAHFIP